MALPDESVYILEVRELLFVLEDEVRECAKSLHIDIDRMVEVCFYRALEQVVAYHCHALAQRIDPCRRGDTLYALMDVQINEAIWRCSLGLFERIRLHRISFDGVTRLKYLVSKMGLVLVAIRRHSDDL